tara:strand:- start:591 stop:719 length:129 start_codon:yes stop_codon:yes gene_type:complete
MDILFKLILAGAFFSTLLCFGFWGQRKLEEYKEYWENEKDGR